MCRERQLCKYESFCVSMVFFNFFWTVSTSHMCPMTLSLLLFGELIPSFSCFICTLLTAHLVMLSVPAGVGQNCSSNSLPNGQRSNGQSSLGTWSGNWDRSMHLSYLLCYPPFQTFCPSACGSTLAVLCFRSSFSHASASLPSVWMACPVKFEVLQYTGFLLLFFFSANPFCTSGCNS